MLLVFFPALEMAILFHHSNWRLPIAVERLLNLVFVTPRMHRIHHSIVQRETNSNWGTIFCWWDKLHHSLRRDIPQDAITIGVAAYRDEQELTLGKLLALTFRQQRPWRLPGGEQPDREPRPTHRVVVYHPQSLECSCGIFEKFRHYKDQDDDQKNTQRCPNAYRTIRIS
jgi:hypothetical protein